MSIIPDPIDPLKGALDGDGRLMGAVFIAPAGTPLDEIIKLKHHIGYSHGPSADTTPPTP